MAFTNVGALTGAEDQAFSFLETTLSGTEGVDCFKGMMPAAHEAWFFAINGGPDPKYADSVQSGTSRPWPSWIFNGEIGGWYAQRTDAQAIIELLLDALPAGTYHGDVALTCIQTIRLDSMPTLDLVTKTLKGNDVYVWELTCNLQIVLNAQTV